MFSKMFRSTTLWLLIAGLCIGYLALPMMASSAKSHFLFLGQPLENSNRLIHKKVQVFLAGDSTVETFRDDVYPMQGWGQRISDFFTSEVSFVNKSVGGRSSKSFIDEGLLDAILNEINPRDYLFIQFGHNDLKSDAKRHTDPYTSYKKYLQMYIDGAEKHDAIPVLITPVARRSYQSDGNLKNELIDYANAMRQLAAEQNVRLIDLNSKSMEYYNSVGVDDVKTIFLWLQPGEFPNYPKGVKDNDHFQETGAYEMAGLVKDGIKELRLPISSFIVPDRIMVNVNGKLAASDIIPVDVKGRLFVPVRAMASIGLAYRWDVVSRSAVITNDNKHELIFTVNDSTAYMNGDAVKLDAAPVMKDGQMLVPIRYLAEAFKISINYEKARKILFLRTIHK